MERKSLVFNLSGLVLPLRGGEVGVRSGVFNYFEQLRQTGNNIYVVNTGETEKHLTKTLKQAKLTDLVTAPVVVTHDEYIGRNYHRVIATAGLDEDKVVNDMLIFGGKLEWPADLEAVFIQMSNEFIYKAEATQKIAKRIYDDGLGDFWVGFENLTNLFKGANEALELDGIEAMFTKSTFRNSLRERLKRRVVSVIVGKKYQDDLEIIR